MNAHLIGTYMVVPSSRSFAKVTGNTKVTLKKCPFSGALVFHKQLV